ncbi:PA domain-containing protein [Colletotrichum truncatum]|uniref:PA domain-containing protein n=1 Tax=Colletotrichum truncatum TaxID=5467 RepID=A0ACC3Z507_COLTU|nr:PA domain-containing protein [Colletotrichum truncatum]KAF6795057.1 PA domain-containing protein [Colletotrichum truncatum]
MTTAYVTTKDKSSPMLESFTGKTASPFSYGNGHVDPVAALDPGLIYNITVDEYIDFLCASRLPKVKIESIVGPYFNCSSNSNIYDLNYPSFSARYITEAAINGVYTAKFKRTVTNVGEAGTYKVDVSIHEPELVKISVEPSELTFNSYGEERGFVVTVAMRTPPENSWVSWGRLIWSDGKHIVGSSMAFAWGDPRSFGQTIMV